jgi:hypothetical protein
MSNGLGRPLMANRFRKFLQSIVYVGMTPDAQQTEGTATRRLRLLAPLERFLSAPSASDPLYLSNRTFGQKLSRALLIALPVAVAGGVAIVAIQFYASKTVKPAKELTPAEIAAKVLPNFNRKFELDTNKDLEVLEVHFEHAASSLLVGNLQNKTSHTIQEAVVVFDLTNARGSQLGGVTVTETNLAPGAVREFKQPIEQSTAAYALVRDVQTH